MEFQKTQITAIQGVARDAYLLSFERTFDFLAGQVIALTLSPEEDPRFYSIASGNNSPFIEILFDVKEGGSLTPRLSVLKAGDTIYYTAPSGCFLPTEEESIWIAAGTGIAPFRSMVLSGITPAVQLIQGARNKEGLYFFEDFSVDFKDMYFPCCSREKTEVCFFGRVTDFLQEKAVFFPDKLYYLCGSAEMVVDCREILLQKGVSYNNIIAEIYF